MATGFGSGKGGIYDNSAAGLYGSMNSAAGAGGVFKDMATYNPTTVNDPNRISGGMSHYMNPYTADVIDRTMGDISRTTDIQQNKNAADAVRAGAFGGARHGLVEAATNENAQKVMADTAAGLHAAGFNTAAQLSGQDLINRLSGAQGMLGTAQVGQGLAESGFNMGTQIGNQQMQQGTFLQQLQQMIMDRAGGQFDATTKQPQSLLDMTMAALGMSPLNKESTTTGQYTPGILDYLSLAAQGVGAWKGMGA